MQLSSTSLPPLQKQCGETRSGHSSVQWSASTAPFECPVVSVLCAIRRARHDMIDLDTALNIVHCVFLGGLQLASLLLYAGGRRYGRRRYEKLKLSEMEADLVKPPPSAADGELTGSDTSEPEPDSELDCNDELLTCNVCDRSFSSPRLLSAHQHKRRHFGCSICESIFQSLLALEQHKEEAEHWTDDEGGQSRDSGSEEDSGEEQQEAKELERLL